MVPLVSLASLVIMDPFLFSGEVKDLEEIRERLVRRALKRHCTWPSREDARKHLSNRGWDRQVLELYVVSKPSACYRDAT